MQNMQILTMFTVIYLVLIPQHLAAFMRESVCGGGGSHFHNKILLYVFCFFLIVMRKIWNCCEVGCFPHQIVMGKMKLLIIISISIWYRWNISSSFSSYSEAFTSEILRNVSLLLIVVTGWWTRDCTDDKQCLKG